MQAMRWYHYISVLGLGVVLMSLMLARTLGRLYGGL